MGNSQINSRPLVSVNVPVYNRPQDIALCIESLFKLDFPKDDYEIIVVDNNSTDNTKAVIQEYPVKYVFEAKRGRGSARNAGVKASTGKYLAFIDSDCIATPHWLTELVKFMEANPRIAACGGKVIPYKLDTWVERYIETKGSFNQELAIEAFKIGLLPRLVTANAIIKSDILSEVGGFDGELFCSIDNELCVRLMLRGFQIGYADKAVVYHCHLRTLKEYCQRMFESGKITYLEFVKYNGILCRRYFFYKTGFFINSILKLLWLPGDFIIRLINAKEYPSKSFVFIEELGRAGLFWGGLLFCVKDMLFLLPPISKPVKLNLDKVLHKSLSIARDGLLFKPVPGVNWFLSNDLIKFMKVKDHSFYGLNETSTRIWQLLCETQDFSRTVESISQEYHIAREAVEKDAQELLGQLVKEKLILQVKAREDEKGF